MAITAFSSAVVSAGLGTFIAWRVYARIRRMVGRQKLSAVRPWMTVCLLPLALMLLAPRALDHRESIFALAGGIGLGIALGFYALRLTKFEQTQAGLFYTPNAHLGIILSLLLLGRIVFRIAELSRSGLPVSAPPPDFAQNPFTLLIIGTAASYYVTYAAGLLRWRKRVGNR